MSRRKQIGFHARLAYYPRDANGLHTTRPRKADYSRMEHCGGPQMAYESERLKTFANWSSPYAKPDDLAKAGFFYSPINDRGQCISDRVKCTFCRGCLLNWEQGEVPAAAHRRAYPTCPFMLNLEVGNIPIKNNDGVNVGVYVPTQFVRPSLLGSSHTNYGMKRCQIQFMTGKARMDTLLNAGMRKNRCYVLSHNGLYLKNNVLCCYKCAFEISLDHSENGVIQAHKEFMPPCAYLYGEVKKSYDVKTITKENRMTDTEKYAREDSWPVTTCINKMGLPKELVCYVAIQLRKFSNYDVDFFEDMVLWTITLRKHIQTCLGVNTYLLKHFCQWKTYVIVEEEVYKEKQRTQFKALCKSISQKKDILPSFIENTSICKKSVSLCYRSLHDQALINEELKNYQNCKICFANAIDVLIIPCHHLIVCSACLNKLRQCPACRNPIECTVDINLD